MSGGGPEQGIAIVGMAGRFPGARSVAELWRNLRAGVESIRFFTPAELRSAGVPASLLERDEYVPARGLLGGVEEMDAAFFGFTPREAELTDPQHRLFLECAWQALEDAACDPARAGGPIGLFGGAGLNTYLLRNLLPNRRLLEAVGPLQTSLHNKADHLTTRVAYELDLRGPAVSVQTACSTSLVAVALACQSLSAYQCDLALAGGVTVTVPEVRGYLHHAGGIESPDGHCRTFDVRAAGTVEGDGVGIVVLKRLADALADGDPIRAVILGAAINNDGAAKVGYTAPGGDGQAEVIATAHAAAGVQADDISYVEAHGTATPLGDPIEVAALTRAFRLTTARRGFCALGSVKTNLGHLDAAAGVAGLIKTVLALEAREIPPSLHFTVPNPALDLAASPFFVNAALRPWPGEKPRRAGVSSFGIGGTNAHLVVQEAPPRPPHPPAAAGAPWQLLLLSAKSGPALEAATANLADHLRERQGVDLADVAYTLQTGRAVFAHRRAIVARTAGDAVEALDTLDPDRVFLRVQEKVRRPLTFLFPGQGAQYPGMGGELYEHLPAYRAEVERCLAFLDPPLAREVRQVLATHGTPGAPGTPGDVGLKTDRRLADTALAQPALFILEHALARLWMGWGLRPQAFLGHSLGEYVAACLAGVMRLPDALRLVAARGRLLATLPPGAMLSVLLPEREVAAEITEPLALAAVNGPSLSVVSGPVEAVEALAARLSARGVVCRRLQTSHAFHSSMMDPVLAAFRREVERTPLHPPELPYLSNRTGTWITAGEATDPHHWVEQLRRTVRFGDGLEALFAEPLLALLEVGPGRTLKTAARWHAAKTSRQVVETSLPHPRERRSDLAFLLGAAGRLWLAGIELDWESVHGGRRRRLSLPTYPFERRRFWVEPPPGGEEAPAAASLDRRPDPADWFYQPVWSEAPRPVRRPAARRWLLFVRDDDRFAARLAARLAGAGAEVVLAFPGGAFARRGDGAYEIPPRGADGYAALFRELAADGTEPDAVVHLWNAARADPADPANPAEPAEPVETTLDLAFHSLIGLAQALAGRAGEEALPLAVVSAAMQPAIGDEPLRAARAVLLGPVRVVPRELPLLALRSIDLLLPAAGSRQEERLIEQLADELLAPAGEAAVALRGGKRWVQGYAQVRLPAPRDAAQRLRPGGVYLLTGGLGGVGLAVAEELARRLRARLVLLGRTALPERGQWEPRARRGGRLGRTLRRLLRLEELGAEILVLPCDVTDGAAVASAVARAVERFGAVHGVFHAAGLPDGGFVQLRTAAASDAVLAPKVQGTLALAAACAGLDLDFLVLFSSISGLVGRHGQVAYGAANAFLDAFAHAHAAATGTFTLAIDWGEWQGIGMAAAPDVQAEAGGEEQEEGGGREMEAGGAWERAASGGGEEAAGGAHPFLERRTVLPSGEEVYTTRFSTERHWVVDEHRMVGNAVVPGVAYFEMIRAALAGRAAGRNVELREVVFVAPIRVRDSGSREVRLHLLPDAADGSAFRFAVRSPAEVDEAGAGEPRDFVLGRAALVAAAPTVRYDLAEIRRRSLRRVPFTEEDREEDLGPRWQNVRVAYVGEREALTHLELADELRGDLAVMKLHPALMDRAAGVAKEYLVAGTYLPLSYGRLTLHRPLPARIWSYARYRLDAGSNLETLTFDTVVLDDDGEVLVEIEDFSQKRINDAATKIRELSARREAPPVEAAPEQPVEMQAAEGVEALVRLLAAGLGPQIAVSVRDLGAVIARADQVAEERAFGPAAAPPARPSHPRPPLATAYRAPAGAAERALASAFSEVLGTEPVGVDDNFFELGGDSVQAIQILAALRRRGLRITPQQFFQHQTIALLAPRAESEGGRPEEEAAPPLPALAPSELAAAGLDPAAVADSYPLSPMQEGMLFQALFAPGSGDYVEQVAWRLAGAFAPAAFAAAWRLASARHPALATSFLWDGLERAMQVVHRTAPPALSRLDLRALPAVRAAAAAEAFLDADRRRGFAPDRPPLVRVTEIVEREGERRFVWTYHHLLLDGWSATLVLAEVARAYAALAAGRAPDLPAAPPYRDYVAWLARQDRQAAAAYWRQALAAAPPPTPLGMPGALETPAPLGTSASPGAPAALVRERLPAEASYHTARAALPAAETERLRALARRHQLTLSSVLQGAWALLLERYGAGTDVIFGAVVSGRAPEIAGVEGMVGLLINTLPVRVRVEPAAPPLRWLRALQEEQLLARRFEHSGLREIREWSGVPADRPLFESILVFENLPPGDAGADGEAAAATLSGLARGAGRTGLPVTVEAFPADRLTVDVTVRGGRFDTARAGRMAGHLLRLVTALADADAAGGGRAGDLPLLTDEEVRQLALWRGPGASLPLPGLPHERFVASAERLPDAAPGLLDERFSAWARRSPDAVAVVCGAERLTYGGLDRRAGRWAARLRQRGVGPETTVALLLPPSIDLVVAILAVLKAGGAYQPLDPAAPAERLALLLADGAPAGVLTVAALAPRLPADGRWRIELDAEPVDGGAPLAPPPAGAPGPERLAYVLHTSGSTGRPKGVEVTHGNVLRLFAAARLEIDFGREDVWSLFHSAAFDFSVWELWGALAHGGRLVVVAAAERSPDRFRALLGREGVTMLSQTPSAFAALDAFDALDAAAALLPLALRHVVFGGEALLPERLAGWYGRHAEDEPRLWNLYGITETTVHVTIRPLSRADAARSGASPIGRPLADLTIDLLDPAGRPVPVGLPAEIHVGGAGLARGYRGAPDLTASRFVPDPRSRSGGRLYRSGDLARYTEDGALQYLGRIDQQVKIRGFRIEPAEIEGALLRLPAIREAAVTAPSDPSGERRLVAYVVPRGGAAPSPEELRGALAATLPDYMLPAAFVILAALPQTANGKIDRRALPALDGSRPDLAAAYVAPAGPAESEVAAVWREVLGLDRVGARDSFFALGGHSLLAARTAGRLRAAFHLEVPVRALFDHPVLADLAAWIAGQQLAAAGDAEVDALLEELDALSDEEAEERLERGPAAEVSVG